MDEQDFNSEREEKAEAGGNQEAIKSPEQEVVEDRQGEKGSPISAQIAAALFESPRARMVAKEIIEWGQAILIAIVLALIIRTFIFTLVKVDGSSMVPTLHDAERLFVVRLFYKPEAGDIIIFRPKNSPGTPYVKRVIALPGQLVDIRDGVVYVDEIPLDEPYAAEKIRDRGDISYPFTVPAGNLFAMGDNRNNSKDCRWKSVGFVDYSAIIGKAVFRLWPLNVFGTVE